MITEWFVEDFGRGAADICQRSWILHKLNFSNKSKKQKQKTSLNHEFIFRLPATLFTICVTLNLFPWFVEFYKLLSCIADNGLFLIIVSVNAASISFLWKCLKLVAIETSTVSFLIKSSRHENTPTSTLSLNYSKVLMKHPFLT